MSDDDEESKCRTEGCTEDPNDGEGFDGYCGNCADRQEEIMGYTHYWRRKIALTTDEMLELGEVVRAIITIAESRSYKYTAYGEPEQPPAKLVICNGMGDRGSRAEITDKRIAFNGMGPDLDHETFSIEQAPDDFSFCKTARKPYDVVVTAVLSVCAFGYGFDVSSDGGIDDWEAGVELAREATGQPIPNPLVVEELTQ